MGTINLEYAKRFKQALIDYGLNELQVELLLTQATAETDRFSFKHALLDNNFAGVKYESTFGSSIFPSKVYFAPKKEHIPPLKVPYAHFENIVEFIGKWIPKAHLNEMIFDNDIGIPLSASSLEQYAHRLKLNCYYQQTEHKYLAGLNKVNSELIEAGLIKEYKPGIKPIENIVNDVNFLYENVEDILNKLRQEAQDNQDLQKSANNNWLDFTKLSYGSAERKPVDGSMLTDPLGIKVGKSALPTSTALTAHDMIIGSKKIATASTGWLIMGWPLAVTAIEAGKVLAQIILRSKDYPHKPSGYKSNPVLKYTDQLIHEIPANVTGIKNIWALPELLNESNSSVLPTSVSDTWNLISSINSISNPVDNLKTIGAEVDFQKYSYPVLSDDPASKYIIGDDAENAPVISTPPDNKFAPIQTPKILSNKQDSEPAAGKTININLNKPMIESFTIYVKDGKDGINDFKHKVEEVLLEILNSANVI